MIHWTNTKRSKKQLKISKEKKLKTNALFKFHQGSDDKMLEIIIQAKSSKEVWEMVLIMNTHIHTHIQIRLRPINSRTVCKYSRLSYLDLWIICTSSNDKHLSTILSSSCLIQYHSVNSNLTKSIRPSSWNIKLYYIDWGMHIRRNKRIIKQ